MDDIFCPKHGHRYVFDYSADAAHPENQCVICIRDDNLALRARLAQVEQELAQANERHGHWAEMAERAHKETTARAEKAEQENARLREALAWRPIETAPHHDWILLDCGNAGIVEGCYSTFEKEDAPRWFDSYGRTIYGPLHWIPLLDMPAARTALGGE